MSSHTETILNHEVFSNYENFLVELENRASDVQECEIEQQERVSRVIKIISYCKELTENNDYDFLTIEELNMANTHLVKSKNQLMAFLDSKTPPNLDAAIVQADALLKTSKSFRFITSSKSVKVLFSHVKEYSSFLESVLAEAKNTVDSLNSYSAKTQQELNETTRSLKELRDSITSEKEQVATISSTFQTQFSDAEARRSTSFDTFIDNKKIEFDDYFGELAEKESLKIAALDESATKKLGEVEVKVDETIKYFSEKKSEARNLLQIIGNIGITGNYKKIADTEKDEAHLYRVIALILMIVASCVASYFVFLGIEKNLPWMLTLTKVTSSFIFLVPAFYAAKESTKHRNAEQHNRSVELQLASLDPFLAKFDSDERNKLKALLLDNYFKEPSYLSKGKTDKPNSVFKELIEKILTKGTTD